jgi:ABC-type branched-subunit amino acid transport system substrate-binding protein
MQYFAYLIKNSQQGYLRLRETRSAVVTLIKMGLLFGILLTGCARSDGVSSGAIPLGNLWEVFVDENGDVDWETASPIAKEQLAGYTFARENIKDYPYNDVVSSEGNRQDDVQVAIRSMVENSENPVAAVIGASSNDATMRVASLVNFFNVPMIVPTANGDNLLPSNNLWAFRLSAPGSAYAKYLFGTLLTKAEFGTEPEVTGEDPKLNIAILYEGNTFGESAAVATVRAAMELGVGVGVYASFPPEKPDSATLNILLNRVVEEGVHLIYLVSSDPNVAITLVQLLQSGIPNYAMPVLVGQAGGFASQDFIDSPEAEGIYILRQQVVPENCPVNIKSIYEAQTFASVYLLDSAVQQVIENQPDPKWYGFINEIINEDTDSAAAFREEVRDVLKQTDTIVPCVGKVAFENTGQVKNPSFELITVTNGETEIGPIDDFINAVKVESLLGSLKE